MSGDAIDARVFFQRLENFHRRICGALLVRRIKRALLNRALQQQERDQCGNRDAQIDARHSDEPDKRNEKEIGEETKIDELNVVEFQRVLYEQLGTDESDW